MESPKRNPIEKSAVVVGDASRALLRFAYACCAILVGSKKRLNTVKREDLILGRVNWYTKVNDPNEVIDIPTPFLE